MSEVLFRYCRAAKIASRDVGVSTAASCRTCPPALTPSTVYSSGGIRRRIGVKKHDESVACCSGVNVWIVRWNDSVGEAKCRVYSFVEGLKTASGELASSSCPVVWSPDCICTSAPTARKECAFLTDSKLAHPSFAIFISSPLSSPPAANSSSEPSSSSPI